MNPPNKCTDSSARVTVLLLMRSVVGAAPAGAAAEVARGEVMTEAVVVG